jgi:peroxiredoxin family protein
MPNYLYCISDKKAPTEDLRGLFDAPIQTFETHGINCFYSCTEKTEVQINRQAAMAHEKVLESIMDRVTIVPIAFGHLVESLDDLREKVVEHQEAKLRETLAFLDGKIELNVKLYWLNMGQVLQTISETTEGIKALKKKRHITRADQIHAGELAAKQIETRKQAWLERLVQTFDDLSHKHQPCNLFGDQMICNQAFLIDRDHLGAFDERVNQFAETLSENEKVKYIGPVPPYNFVDLRVNLT